MASPSGAMTGLDPMPGDPSTAADLPGLAGSPRAQQQPSPDVQAQLRNATDQMRSMIRSVDTILDGVKGIATTFPTQGDEPKQLMEMAGQMKKLITAFVMNTVKQAPTAPTQPQGGSPLALR